MDESWDADFDGELRVPDSVAETSTSVRSEVVAARKLAAVTQRLRLLLLQGAPPNAPRSALRNAALLVQASTTNESDEFFTCDAYKQFAGEKLEVRGSIEDVLRHAISVEREIERARA